MSDKLLNWLKVNGYDVLQCTSDRDAIDKSDSLKHGSKMYPVHFSVSDTSGEKMYEEFYTEQETVDMQKYSSLGVITNKSVPDKIKLQ